MRKRVLANHVLAKYTDKNDNLKEHLMMLKGGLEKQK